MVVSVFSRINNFKFGISCEMEVKKIPKVYMKNKFDFGSFIMKFWCNSLNLNLFIELTAKKAKHLSI